MACSAVAVVLLLALSVSSRAHDPYEMFDNSSLLLVRACGQGEGELLRSEIEGHQCTLIDEVEKEAACSVTAVICPDLLHFEHGVAEVFTEDAGAYLRGAGLPQAWDPGPRSSRNDFYTEWRDYDAILARLQDVVDAAPGVAVLEDLAPATHERRIIKAVRIRDSAWTSGAPRIVINCLLHAREWLASMVGAYLVEYCVDKKKNDPSWLAGMELVIVPIANPDGFIFSQTSNAMWRKNRATNAGSSCPGVDLNRNWPTDWNGGESTSTSPCSDIYVGPSAASEPETQALAAVLAEAPVSLHLDIHSYGEMILGPWSYTNADHPDKATIDAIGLAMRGAIQSVNGKTYLYGTGDGGGALYLASGVAPDASTELAGAYGYTIELPPASAWGSAGFQPSTSEILPACAEIFEAVDTMAEWFRVRDPTPAPPPTPPPLPTPAPLFMWADITGECTLTLDGACVDSPNYPGNYGRNQACTLGIHLVSAAPIVVESFNTERGYDTLTVNGEAYSGTTGPSGVTPTTSILWVSDWSEQGTGWRLCVEAPPTPAPPTPACADDDARMIELASGFGFTIRGCADVRSYCEHPAYGNTLRATCPETCGLCAVTCADDDTRIVDLASGLGLTIRGCADVRSYCEHPTYGNTLQAICPATCGLCRELTDAPIFFP